MAMGCSILEMMGDEEPSVSRRLRHASTSLPVRTKLTAT